MPRTAVPPVFFPDDSSNAINVFIMAPDDRQNTDAKIKLIDYASHDLTGRQDCQLALDIIEIINNGACSVCENAVIKIILGGYVEASKHDIA